MGKSSDTNNDSAVIFTGGGEMGARIREFDWETTPLGAVEAWPQSLKTAVQIVLNSRYPMFIWWGEALVNLYNDSYAPILGERHPQALGQSAPKIWADIWSVVGPQSELVLRKGQSTWSEDLLLLMERNDFVEETYFSYSYSPVPADHGDIGGVFCACSEETRRVLSQRRLKMLRDLGERSVVEAKSVELACRAAAATLAENSFDIPFALIYLLEDGKTARLCETVGIDTERFAARVELGGGQDVWDFGRSLETGEIRLVDGLEEKFGRLPAGVWTDDFTRRAVVLPLSKSGAPDQPAGFLVAGLSPRLPFDEEYRGFVELSAAHLSTVIGNAYDYEEERRRVEALDALNRAKTEFFSNVSHEFRTPLTLMLGNLEAVLENDGALPENEKRQVEAAHRNSLRLLKLVNTLLDFSRIEAERQQAAFQPTALGELTAELAANFRSAIENAGMTLTVDCPPLSEPIYVDREMWEKIVLNLLSNAFKFTFAGGIEVALTEHENAVRLNLGDTGVGIPADQISEIFKRFHRVRSTEGRSHEGTGIGLSLVEELVKTHGGSVAVESEFGRGTVFTIEIPKGKAHLPPPQVTERAESFASAANRALFLSEIGYDAPETSKSETAAAGGRGPASILLVDDNRDMRDYVRRLLETAGYRVETAGDGRAALEFLRGPEPLPDLVLSDVMMPHLDGFGLLKNLRDDERTRTLPVILLSARAGEESKIEGLEARADDYLVKPFSARELLARVRANLEMARVRRKAADDLRESENRFRSIADAAPVLIWITDPAGRAVWFNKVWLEFGGRTIEAELGDGWAENIHPDDREKCRAAYTAAVATRKAFSTEYRLRRADGVYCWLLANGIPNYAPDGEFLGHVGSCIDISKIKSTEDALRRNEERLRLALEGGGMGVWNWRFGSDEIEVDDKFLALYGIAPAEFDGKNATLNERVHPDDLDAVRAANRAAIADRTDFAMDFRIIQPPTGEIRWIAGFGRAVYDEAGNPLEVNGVNFDITERKRIELRNRFIIQLDETVRPLETPEEITRALARLLGEYLGADRCAYAEVEADEDHFYIPGDYTRGATPSIVGRYAMASFGAEVLRRMRANLVYVVHDVDDDPQVREDDLAAYRQTAIRAVICVPLHKNGRFSACMAVHQRQPRRWTPEEVALVSFVANRFWESIERARVVKSLNDSLVREQDARHSAETANRVKDEFLATLSHELRTPLNAILGWATMLRGGRMNTVDSARALETVERSARAQSQLIDDLLDISRIITGKLRLEITGIDLSKVIEAAVDAVRPAAEARDIELRIDLDERTDAISGDASRLQQVVWNLVANAVKFTPRGGRVEIGLKNAGPHAEITIDDTGKGIEPEFLPYIFDRFRQADQTTTRRQGGLGLGLSIVRQLVEMHGGTVQAESEGEGRGSRFTVRLPRIAAAAARDENNGPARPAAGDPIQFRAAAELAGLNLLIVDDEDDSRLLLRTVLVQCGARVTAAASAAEAFEALQKSEFDALVSDIGMPDVDGYMLIGKIRALPDDRRRIPAIALTAYARAEDRVRVLNAGFQAHLPKPVEPAELIAVIVGLAKSPGTNHFDAGGPK